MVQCSLRISQPLMRLSISVFTKWRSGWEMSSELSAGRLQVALMQYPWLNSLQKLICCHKKENKGSFQEMICGPTVGARPALLLLVAKSKAF